MFMQPLVSRVRKKFGRSVNVVPVFVVIRKTRRTQAGRVND